MPVVTFVHSATDAHDEQFFIDNADVGYHHGHFTCSLTETQFRDNFKSRGSEQEIDDLVARASFLIVAGAILTALVILIALAAVTGASGAVACN